MTRVLSDPRLRGSYNLARIEGAARAAWPTLESINEVEVAPPATPNDEPTMAIAAYFETGARTAAEVEALVAATGAAPLDALTVKQRAAVTRLEAFVSHDPGTTGAQADAFLGLAGDANLTQLTNLGKVLIRNQRAIATILARIVREVREEQ